MILWHFIFVWSIFQSLGILYFWIFWDLPDNLYEIDGLPKLIFLIWFLTLCIYSNWFGFDWIFEGMFCWTNNAIIVKIWTCQVFLLLPDAKLVWISCIWFSIVLGLFFFRSNCPSFIQVFFETQWKEKKIVTVTFILGANMKIILNKVNIWMIQSVINTFELPLIYPLKILGGFLVFSGTMGLEHWLEMG